MHCVPCALSPPANDPVQTKRLAGGASSCHAPRFLSPLPVLKTGWRGAGASRRVRWSGRGMVRPSRSDAAGAGAYLLASLRLPVLVSTIFRRGWGTCARPLSLSRTILKLTYHVEHTRSFQAVILLAVTADVTSSIVFDQDLGGPAARSESWSSARRMAALSRSWALIRPGGAAWVSLSSLRHPSLALPGPVGGGARGRGGSWGGGGEDRGMADKAWRRKQDHFAKEVAC